MTRAWSLALCLALLAAASAQEPTDRPGYRRLDEPALPADLSDGARVTLVWLKFHKLFGDNLKVYHEALTDRLFVRDPALQQKLNRGVDSGEAELARRANIQVFGKVRTLRDQQILDVEDVRVLESDATRYARRAQSLPAGDAERRLELAREIYQAVLPQLEPEERPPLAQLVTRLREEARGLEQAELRPLPEGAAGWIRFGERYGDVASLAAVQEQEGVDAALRERAEKSLRRLDARQYLGKWLTAEAFREQLGLVLRGEAGWVSKAQVGFEEACQRHRRYLGQGNPWPIVTDETLAQSARDGKIAKSMRKDMVLLAIRNSHGESRLPVRIARLREAREGGEEVWEHWVMQDGLNLYFFNGRVFEDFAGEPPR